MTCGRQVCDKGALFLGKSLSVNESLQELFLHGNHLEIEGVRAMGQYVGNNSTLLRVTLTSAEDAVDVQVGESFLVLAVLTGLMRAALPPVPVDHAGLSACHERRLHHRAAEAEPEPQEAGQPEHGGTHT